MESEAETFHISVAPGIAPGALKRALNAQLPSGLAIQNCKAIPHAKRMGKPSARVEYQVVLKDGVFEAAHLEEFKRAKNFVFSRQTRKGAVEEIDLKNIVDDLRLRDPATLVMVLNNQSQKVVRPLEVIKQISHLSGELLLQARVTKKRSVAARKASKRTHTQKN
jgi:radical SAM-linked protein